MITNLIDIPGAAQWSTRPVEIYRLECAKPTAWLRAGIDIREPPSYHQFVDCHMPRGIINCYLWTQ